MLRYRQGSSIPIIGNMGISSSLKPPIRIRLFLIFRSLNASCSSYFMAWSWQPRRTGLRASWLCPKSRRSDHLHQTGKTIGFFHLHGFRPHLVADDRIFDKPDVAVKLSDTGAVLAHIFNGNCKFLIFSTFLTPLSF